MSRERLVFFHTLVDTPLNSQKVAILVDDMIDTGNTLSLAVKTLHERGAKSIVALISHGLYFLPFLISLTDLEV
jgi:phosphoribosylpyrophosphate synthetase